MAKSPHTPVMQQYLAFKRKHQDAVLLFRMGDFYEVFFEDARTCARDLGLALTSRDKGAGAVPMAGFPHHAADGYIRRLIRAGHRVAVCEQVQDPAEARGLVDRDVTRIITAGTLTEEHILDSRSNNYLAAVALSDAEAGVAWVDLSTGRFEVEEVPVGRLADSLARVRPAECLLSEASRDEDSGGHPALPCLPEGCLVTRLAPWQFGREEGRRRLNEHFGTATLQGFGCDDLGPGLGAAGAVLVYLQETQRAAVGQVRRIERFLPDRYLVLDATTQRALELVEPMRGGGRDGSLLGVLDRTRTPMGSRLMRRRILTPLRDPALIERRLEAVQELFAAGPLRAQLAGTLEGIYDIERLTARVCCGRANARDLVGLRRSLMRIPQVATLLAPCTADLLAELRGAMDPVPEAESLIAAAIRPDPPTTLTDGDLIQDGYHPELDDLRATARQGRDWIARFEADETQRTGIPSLKVGFNKVFGYYIEVTNAHKEKVPADYVRKQTLKNAERYITPELKERESAVLTAGERARQLEYDLFQDVRRQVAEHTARLQATAEALAALDVALSLAAVAAEAGYVRPRIDEGLALRVRDGRHPVLEQMLDEEFVPNDLEFDPERARLLVITGPNMAGKSVYIRQAALIVLMAQMGSFVPAGQAEVGLVDRVFTRVGATDEQRRGQSTFMVEMVEVANILNNATERSLIILDEVGRGTSTFDGVSIAWAAAEYIHNHLGARTLFATHYHELAQLADTLERVRNLNVAVREWKTDVVFLHRVVPGATDRSYGIHVARLAGVPPEVQDRAREILAHLEENAVGPNDQPRFAPQPRRPGPRPRPVQMPLFRPLDDRIRQDLLALEPEAMTPLEALTHLTEIVRRLREQERP
ncbi:MAG: DNA mismatch repair protein MutS [Candidatus Brocadiaceae bacterium]|nr:DNA mismatch repair protein MutS [Candidatus Brocadiaceae bacterium]